MKESVIHVKENTKVLTDPGYLGLQKIHTNTHMPRKKLKKYPITKEHKRRNKELLSQRVLNEHVIGKIKRSEILCDRYRNKNKRFGLRCNLIAVSTL